MVDTLAPDESMRFEQHERRGDGVAAALIEAGIDLERRQGRLAAINFLLERNVPHHVILRVLSCAAFRRKSQRVPRRAGPA